MTTKDTKVCRVCHQDLPVEEFSRDRKSKDGLQGICKPCYSLYHRERYTNDPEYRERNRLRMARWQKENPERYNNHQAKYRTTYPEKDRAKSAIKILVRAGKMPRAQDCKCKNCGEPAVEYHHHRGYLPEHWRSVIPLCKACHTREHLIL